MLSVNRENPDLIDLVRRAGKYRLEIRDYLQKLRVGGPETFGERDAWAVEDAQFWLEAHPFGPRNFEKVEDVPFPGMSEFRVQAIGHRGMNLLVRDLKKKRHPAVGAIYSHLPFVQVENRGRGIGTLMVIAADLHGRFLNPTHFSESGFCGRLNAHAFQVEVAIRAGLDDVPESVRAQYDITEAGRCQLKTPWTVEDQNAQAEAAREAEMELDFGL